MTRTEALARTKVASNGYSPCSKVARHPLTLRAPRSGARNKEMKVFHMELTIHHVRPRGGTQRERRVEALWKSRLRVGEPNLQAVPPGNSYEPRNDKHRGRAHGSGANADTLQSGQMVTRTEELGRGYRDGMQRMFCASTAGGLFCCKAITIRKLNPKCNRGRTEFGGDHMSKDVG